MHAAGAYAMYLLLLLLLRLLLLLLFLLLLLLLFPWRRRSRIRKQEVGGGTSAGGGSRRRHQEDRRMAVVSLRSFHHDLDKVERDGCMLTCDVAWKFCYVMWWHLDFRSEDFDIQAVDFLHDGLETLILVARILIIRPLTSA